MLIQFSVKNYKSFKDTAIFSFLASNYDKTELEEQNVVLIEKYGLRLLKSGIIYGANASGKTKLFDALNFFKTFVVRTGLKSEQGDLIPVEPFRLDDYSQQNPTEFEIIFLYKDNIYRYGFETTSTSIVSEWLFFKEKKKEIQIFYREGEVIEKINEGYFKKGNLIKSEDLLRNNILLLSLSAGLLKEKGVVGDVYSWINTNLKLSSGLTKKSEKYTQSLVSENTQKKNEIIQLFNGLDIHISNIEIETDVEKILNKMSELSDDDKEEIRNKISQSQGKILGDTILYYKKYDKEYRVIGEEPFSMERQESSGTRKFFGLSGSIIDTLENGYTLILDEFEAKLHSNLVEKIVSIFNSKEGNRLNAQLLATTHNTNILSNKLLRRDQIWFIEKNKYGESSLYSLSDFSVKSDENYEKNYVRGKYGAIPKITNLEYFSK